jgi:tetratricopeptide (TPR) repeat protein
MMKKLPPIFRHLLPIICLTFSIYQLQAQALRIPQNQNLANKAGRRVGVTEIDIKWNAPAVRAREGKIWGTNIAPYGYTVLGFGSNVESPWRAGADECTTMSFTTDVTINGMALAAGKYAFFIAVYPDSCVLIFNKNVNAWGSYFYDKSLDVLHVTTMQKKNQTPMQERLAYVFDNQTDNSVEVALLWENWKIPFTVGVDLKKTTLADIKTQMSGAIGFDPPSLVAAANWCLQNEINLPEALNWINSATDPNLGGTKTFNALSTKSKLLEKTGKTTDAVDLMKQAIEVGTAIELHLYGRQLLNQKKASEAMSVFDLNYKKHNGAWPTNVGMMRDYSATGNIPKALEHAKLALTQAPDDQNKQSLTEAIKKLESGKAL